MKLFNRIKRIIMGKTSQAMDEIELDNIDAIIRNLETEHEAEMAKRQDDLIKIFTKHENILGKVATDKEEVKRLERKVKALIYTGNEEDAASLAYQLECLEKSLQLREESLETVKSLGDKLLKEHKTLNTTHTSRIEALKSRATVLDIKSELNQIRGIAGVSSKESTSAQIKEIEGMITSKTNEIKAQEKVTSLIGESDAAVASGAADIDLAMALERFKNRGK